MFFIFIIAIIVNYVLLPHVTVSTLSHVHSYVGKVYLSLLSSSIISLLYCLYIDITLFTFSFSYYFILSLFISSCFYAYRY